MTELPSPRARSLDGEVEVLFFFMGIRFTYFYSIWTAELEGATICFSLLLNRMQMWQENPLTCISCVVGSSYYHWGIFLCVWHDFA